MTRVAKRCLVTGRVQGVFFRASTQQVAEKMGLSGWVRNLADGRVEVYACGEMDKLQALCDWLQQGPEQARVERLECSDCEVTNLTGFELRF